MEEKEIAKKGSTIVTDDKETKHNKTKIWIIVVIAIALLAILVSVLVVVAQNNAEAERKKEEQLEAEFLFAKDAYRSLNSAAKDADKIMSGIYNAWYFAIYEADEYFQEQKVFAFADAIDADWRTVDDAMEELNLLDGFSYSALEDFNSALMIARKVYEETGLYSKCKSNIDYANAMLSKISSENYEYTEYNELVSYYSAISSYYEFVKSPSGSFAQLAQTRSNFQTQISTYKNQLSVTFN